MHRLLVVLPLAILLFPLNAHAGEAPRSTLRVVQWNAFYDGQGTDGVRDRGRQVAVLAALAPDVVSLNEVTAKAAVDYAARMQRATGIRWHHHHAAGSRGWGNAILSRYPLLATSAYMIKVGAQRSVAQATLSVNGSRVNMFATHLDSGNRPKNRAAQVQELIAFVSGFPAPRIIAGDMNAGPDAGEIQALFSAYEDAWLAAVYRGTARGYDGNPAHRYTRTRRTRLDYIFVSRDVTANECAVPDLRDRTSGKVEENVRTADDEGVRPSDHNLVTCVLTWEGAPPATNGPVRGVADEDDELDEDADRFEDLEPPAPAPEARAASTWPCAASPPAPQPVVAASPDEIVLRPAADGVLAGSWIVEFHCGAAGGAAVVDPDMHRPKLPAEAAPVDYVDMTFHADAGKPYRLWVRAKATRDGWRNDSIWVQFSGSVDALGAPVYRIGTPGRTRVILEDCIGCGLSGWGWQDNGFGAGVLGAEIYFETTGPQTIRIQRREDGIAIDQIVLSTAQWLTVPPGALTNDATILPATADRSGAR